MAGETIDDMIDATMTADNKAARKRHLLDGPEELAAFALTAERQVDLPTSASDNRA